MTASGRLVRELLTGTRARSAECKFFAKQVFALENYVWMKPVGPSEQLQRALKPFRLMDRVFHEYLHQERSLAKEVMAQRGFMDTPTPPDLLARLDEAFARVYTALTVKGLFS